MRINDDTITVERGTALGNLLEAADSLYSARNVTERTYGAALESIRALTTELQVAADAAEQD